MNITTKSLFDLTKTITADYLSQFECPWEALAGLKNYIIRLGRTLDTEKFYSPSENVWIAKSASVSPSAEINPPCIIDEGAEIRHCAFIRGSAVVGKNTVVGKLHRTEKCDSVRFRSGPAFQLLRRLHPRIQITPRGRFGHIERKERQIERHAQRRSGYA